MAETAATQLSRLLRVIPRIADGEEHRLTSVAKLAEVDPKVVLGDLRAVALRLDDPAGYVEGVSICIEADQVSVSTPHFLRPMRLTLAELCALELGLAMLRGERPPDERPAIDRARDRLRAAIARLPDEAIPEGLRTADAGASGDPGLLAAIRAAIRDRRELRLAYRKSGATESTSRVVQPYAVVAASGAWYVIGHCARSEAVRVFRLDRVESVEQLDGHYEVAADFSLANVLKDGRVFSGAAPSRLRVRYSPRIARWIAEREGLEVEADGSLVMEHPLADLDWAVRHVLQYGADAEVLGPEVVREEIVRRLRGTG